MINYVECSVKDKSSLDKVIIEFVKLFEPLEKDNIIILQDKVTEAYFCECHIKADKLVNLGTIDAPLDPETQPDYRANREIVEDSAAFLNMIEDAKKHRIFNNIVCEYSAKNVRKKPLKVIGGQHRYSAIKTALKDSINEWHGIKIYFLLDSEQRLDVQLVSNTNIAVSSDLLDRMFETVRGPELRNWCQKTGLLEEKSDFADKKQRGSRITVRLARMFIINFYAGKQVPCDQFNDENTTPAISKTGGPDMIWEQTKIDHPNWADDKELLEAGKQFAKLVEVQNTYFSEKGPKEYADKALNYAILSGWAYVAGVLQSNIARLKRHYELPDTAKKDPLNAAALADARHKTDPVKYRGLGTRADAKERARITELFFLQAEKGQGITKKLADVAIMKYQAKQANLEAKAAEKRI